MPRQKNLDPLYYHDAPIEKMTIAELTDALGIDRAAELLNTSRRAIYTVRNTNVLSIARHMLLIEEVKRDAVACRRRLILLQQRQIDKDARRA